MEDHYGALEADFLREYGLDLGSCLETMGCRKLEALINGLPQDSTSAVARATDESIRLGWGYNEELLAIVAEVLDWGNRNFLAANGVKIGRIPKAIHIDRPLKPRTKRNATPEETKRIFGGGPMIKAQESEETNE